MACAEIETQSNCDRNNSIRIIALHKLYQDDGISYYPSKSTCIFEQGSAGSGMLPDEIQICFYDTSLNTAYSASIDNCLLNEAGEIDEYKDDTTDDENNSEGEHSGIILNKNKLKVQSQPKKCHTISDSDEDTENDNFGT